MKKLNSCREITDEELKKLKRGLETLTSLKQISLDFAQ